jgi:DnaK suppressor protein
MSDLDKKALKAYKKSLDSRLKDLQTVQATSAESREPVALDQTTTGRLSRMDALQVQAMALETDRRRDLEITRVETALDRMKHGEFGYCVTCGDEVEIKRLDNDPSTPTCIGCARGSIN